MTFGYGKGIEERITKFIYILFWWKSMLRNLLRLYHAFRLTKHAPAVYRPALFPSYWVDGVFAMNAGMILFFSSGTIFVW